MQIKNKRMAISAHLSSLCHWFTTNRSVSESCSSHLHTYPTARPHFYFVFTIITQINRMRTHTQTLTHVQPLLNVNWSKYHFKNRISFAKMRFFRPAQFYFCFFPLSRLLGTLVFCSHSTLIQCDLLMDISL